MALGRETAMGVNASEVSDWLRQHAGKRDHREVLSDDVVVIRPGPNFDWLMGNPAPTQPLAPAPEPDPAGEVRSKTDDRGERGSSTRA